MLGNELQWYVWCMCVRHLNMQAGGLQHLWGGGWGYNLVINPRRACAAGLQQLVVFVCQVQVEQNYKLPK